jgi:hypothetical protein
MVPLITSFAITGTAIDSVSGKESTAVAPAIMDSVPQVPDQQTRNAVTARITAHLTRGWPRLGEPLVCHRGQYCHVAALLPGRSEATPILRLRYQGSEDHRVIGICKASPAKPSFLAPSGRQQARRNKG